MSRGLRPSSIIVGSGVIGDPRSWAPVAAGRRVMLVSEPGAWRRFGRAASQALARAGAGAAVHLLPAGERAKTPAAVAGLYRVLARAGVGRDGTVVALGGGSVTDAAGFAAATWLRGVAWISVPTTLLGQVDGGIGGKTAIDLPEGKNLVGAFHQPERVLCDLSTLSSLPRREVVSGLGEALKYGLALDRGLWDGLRARWDRLCRLEPAAAAWAVGACARWKARIVGADPDETRGEREKLNFGHTVAHALEAATGFRKFRHGEGVVWGMRAALALSTVKTGLAPRAAAEADAFLAGIPVPRWPRAATAETLWPFVVRDKKARGGRPRFILLRAVGRSAAVDTVGPRDLARALAAIVRERP